MSLKDTIKFQKTLSLFERASNAHEKKAAAAAARRVMEACNLDPVTVPNGSLYSRLNFADSTLLKKQRDEWREAHPDYYYKTDSHGHTRRLRGKPRRRRVVNNTEMFKGLFDDFMPETDKDQ